MTKADLVNEVARVADLTIEASETAVTAVFEAIAEALVKGERVELRGFGSFSTRHRRARLARNPKTGVSVSVPAKNVPFFKMSKELWALMNA